jgi:hypothetical protein
VSGLMDLNEGPWDLVSSGGLIFLLLETAHVSFCRIEVIVVGVVDVGHPIRETGRRCMHRGT